MVEQAQPQFAFVAQTIGQAELEQDRLQQRPPRAEAGTGGQHDIEPLVVLGGEHLQQQRLAGAGSADHEARAIAAFDRAAQPMARVFDRRRWESSARLAGTWGRRAPRARAVGAAKVRRSSW